MLILLVSSTFALGLRSKIEGSPPGRIQHGRTPRKDKTKLARVRIPVVKKQTTFAEAFEKARECYALECDEEKWDCGDGKEVMVCLSELGK